VETTLATGAWAFVAGTFDGNQVRLYVNGDPVGERSAAPISHSTGSSRSATVPGRLSVERPDR